MHSRQSLHIALTNVGNKLFTSFGIQTRVWADPGGPEFQATVDQAGARSSLDLWRGQQMRHLGAWDSVPNGFPRAGQDQLHGHAACAVAQDPVIQRAPRLNALL